jgi:uncharacterized membrane protein
MFVIILLDIALSLSGSLFFMLARRAKDPNKKLLLILSAVISAALIFCINYKFIPSKYWWVVSFAFSLGIFVPHFNHSKYSYAGNNDLNSYKGD